ncbi:DUF998 domain-containing protein [Streptomyces sp. NPDC012421]|uniref:DUF998 domain-containing protein n=1 Tax=Streptomyces sp. NPDC012421 TaxID=3364832 RepID=UPI0036E918C8
MARTMTGTTTAVTARAVTAAARATAGAGVRVPLALIGAGALAMAAVELLNPGYDLISEALSRYVHGTAGGLLPAALLAVATASAVLTARLPGGAGRVRDRAGRVRDWAGRVRDRAGRAAVALWAAGILIAGVFPADPPGHHHRPSPSELVHGSAAFLAFAALPAAALLLRRTLAAARPRLRTALNALAAASLLGTAALAVLLADVMDGGPSLGLGGAPTLLGLVERFVLAADFAWVAVALLATATATGTVAATATATATATGAGAAGAATGAGMATGAGERGRRA